MSNEITKVDKNEITQGGAIRGFEHIDKTNITIPQIKVLQATSPEVKERIGVMGDIIHTATNSVTNGEFVPLLFWQSKCFFAPRDQSVKLKLFQELNIEDDTGYMNIVCMAKNGMTPEFSAIGRGACAGCQFSQWHGNKPPMCSESINVFAYLLDIGMPGVIRFTSTNYKYGKKFRDGAMWLGADLFRFKYQMVAKLVDNNKGEFYVTPIKSLGRTTDDEYAMALQMYNDFGQMVVADDTTFDGEDAMF